MPSLARSRMRRTGLLAAMLVVGSAIVGCGGAVGGAQSSRPAGARTPAAVRLLPPAAFAAEATRPRTVIVNVHVPDQGSLPETDLDIPFDQIAQRRAQLPSRDTPLAVYCRTGRMSALAVKQLRSLGFERISELRGGMLAWRASGRTLLPAES